jgi:hypothetical protein
MSNLVVYTCILDHWDYLRPPLKVDPNARYICFSNRPMPRVDPWEIQPAFTPFQCNKRNARIPKMLPHLHFEADYSVYHDGNMQLKLTPGELIDRYLSPDRDIAMLRHPCRKSAGEESVILLKEKIGDAGEVRKQVERWKEHGSPDGLWCGGFIIRRHSELVTILNNAWWQEFRIGCERDQMALPIARSFLGIPIHTIDGDIHNNGLMAFNYHSAWKDKGDNPQQEAALRPYVDRAAALRRVVTA